MTRRKIISAENVTSQLPDFIFACKLSHFETSLPYIIQQAEINNLSADKLDFIIAVRYAFFCVDEFDPASNSISLIEHKLAKLLSFISTVKPSAIEQPALFYLMGDMISLITFAYKNNKEHKEAEIQGLFERLFDVAQNCCDNGYKLEYELHKPSRYKIPRLGPSIPVIRNAKPHVFDSVLYWTDYTGYFKPLTQIMQEIRKKMKELIINCWPQI